MITDLILIGQVLGCKPGWYNINSRCVHLNLQQLTWQAARDTCLTQGGDLFSVQSEAELSPIQVVGMTGAWIGLNTLTDKSNPRVYVWSDNTPVLCKFFFCAIDSSISRSIE